MDDLDRLAFRLVRTIRQHHPQLREQGFTLTDLEERLLPYREARREMADAGADAWERTVLRLISGERSYLSADADLQQACRRALSLPSPTLALVRTWSGAILSLGEEALLVGTERVSGAFDSARLDKSLTADPSRAATVPRAVRGAPSSLVTDAGLAGADGSRGPSQRGGPSVVGRPSVVAQARNPVSAIHGNGMGEHPVRCCRFCGGRLPGERRVTFCPHCGLDQTKRQCPACSTELDAAWRFCVTCGRSADLPETPSIPKRAAR